VAHHRKLITRKLNSLLIQGHAAFAIVRTIMPQVREFLPLAIVQATFAFRVAAVLLAELLDKLKGLYCARGLQSLDLKEVKGRATRCVLEKNP